MPSIFVACSPPVITPDRDPGEQAEGDNQQLTNMLSPVNILALRGRPQKVVSFSTTSWQLSSIL